MKIKVHDGTGTLTASSLCESCAHSSIVRGRRVDELIVDCQATVMRGRRITFIVTSCTDYHDAHEPSYHELVRKAWILDPKSRRRRAGFVRGNELTPDEFMDTVAEAVKEPEEF